MQPLRNLRSYRFENLIARLNDLGWEEQPPTFQGWVFAKSNGIRTMIVTVSALDGATIESFVRWPAYTNYFLYASSVTGPVKLCKGCGRFMPINKYRQLIPHRKGFLGVEACIDEVSTR